MLAMTSLVAPLLLARTPPIKERSSCPHMPPTSGPSMARDTLNFCHVLMRAHRLGLSNSSLFVDVGADVGTEARLARGFGHLVVSFECRGAHWLKMSSRPAFADDAGMRLVHACVSDRNGLGVLHKAMDSSSMMKSSVQDPGAAWKARREQRSGGAGSGGAAGATEPVPVVTLDSAVGAASIAALWPGLAHARVGFVKIDVQGVEGAVLTGALGVLREHAPFIFYEDSMLPTEDRKGVLLARLLAPSGGLSYVCECDNDCFCQPTGGRRGPRG